MTVTWHIYSIHLVKNVCDIFFADGVWDWDNSYTCLLKELDMCLWNVRNTISLIDMLSIFFLFSLHIASNRLSQNTIDWSSVVWDLYQVVSFESGCIQLSIFNKFIYIDNLILLGLLDSVIIIYYWLDVCNVLIDFLNL